MDIHTYFRFKTAKAILHIQVPMHSAKTASILGLLVLFAAGAVWFLCPPDPPVWRLRTVFRIGTSISPAAVIEGSPQLQSPIERFRTVVASISDPIFRQEIVEGAKFEAATSARSRQLVFNTLRANALNDYDITVELTAASPADTRAAYRAIADKIGQLHAALSEQNVKLLQGSIDEYQERAGQLKKWENARVQPGIQSSADNAGSNSDIGPIWAQTREYLRQLEVAKHMVKPTTFPPDALAYVYGPLSGNSVRLSALAGLAVVMCAIMLAFGLENYTAKRRARKI